MKAAIISAGALPVSICISIISRSILNATVEQTCSKPIRCYFCVNIFLKIKKVLSNTSK